MRTGILSCRGLWCGAGVLHPAKTAAARRVAIRQDYRKILVNRAATATPAIVQDHRMSGDFFCSRYLAVDPLTNKTFDQGRTDYLALRSYLWPA